MRILVMPTASASRARQIHHTDRARLDGPVKLFAAVATLGASTSAADDAAEAWLVRHVGPDQE